MKGKHFSWITVWLIVVCVLLVVSGSYAAYSSVWYAKGVAAAQIAATDLPFSSNYLELKNDGVTPEKMIAATKDANGVAVTITICNYPQADRLKYHTSALPYALTAKLVDAKEADYDKFTLNNQYFTNGVCELSGSLSGDGAQQDQYVLRCNDPQLLNKVSIQMEAVPRCTDNCGLVNRKLLGQLRIMPMDSSPQEWTGRITDKPQNGEEVDAFNYLLTGTATDTITLNWDPKHVELSKWSREDLEKNTSGFTEKQNGSISFGVGGETTSYRLQFYRRGSFPSSEIEEYISYSLASKTATTPPEASES